MDSDRVFEERVWKINYFLEKHLNSIDKVL